MSILKLVPTDEGFLGRECNSPSCKKYFRVYADSIKEEMHCPYCGEVFSNSELHTTDQINYFREAAKEKAIAYARGELDKMFAGLSRQFSGNKHVTIKHTPSARRPRTVAPTYTESKVDSELKCPDCGFLFQVYGVFGFCPGCNTENMLIYDANISIIRKEISEAPVKNRVLRHAYDDLVATFEHFCLSRAAGFEGNKPSFQDLFEARRYFKEKGNLDILDGITPAESLCARRIFQKRHAYQHAGGKITDKYVRRIPEDSTLLGTDAELSELEFEEGARIFRVIIGKLAAWKNQ